MNGEKEKLTSFGLNKISIDTRILERDEISAKKDRCIIVFCPGGAVCVWPNCWFRPKLKVVIIYRPTGAGRMTAVILFFTNISLHPERIAQSVPGELLIASVSKNMPRMGASCFGSLRDRLQALPTDHPASVFWKSGCFDVGGAIPTCGHHCHSGQ